MKAEFPERGILPLLIWYEENARDLPWRRDVTPYRVWVSEIMLQQTRVAAVVDYFCRFVRVLPTVEALARVEEEELLKLWQGLGYYSRARNLRRAAREIMDRHGGEFPREYEEIRALSGIGDYTAGAISSIAFSQPRPAVDGNVLRVVTRLTGDRRDIAARSTKEDVTRLIREAIPHGAPGKFNQALMEVGATVCLPNGAPLCDRCPLAEDCAARREQLTHIIPVRGAKKPRRVEERQVFLFFFRGQVALRRREDRGLLAGLWEYPNLLRGQSPPADWPAGPAQPVPGGRGKHIFTHIEWRMESVSVRVEKEDLPAGWVWADAGALREKYPIPSAFESFRKEVEEQLCKW